jgi:hypothetical protein
MLLSFQGTVTGGTDIPMLGVSLGDTITGAAFIPFDRYYNGGLSGGYGGLPTLALTDNGQTYISPGGSGFYAVAGNDGLYPDWDLWGNPGRTVHDYDVQAWYQTAQGGMVTYASMTFTTQPLAPPPSPSIGYGYPPEGDLVGSLLTDINPGFLNGTFDYFANTGPNGPPYEIKGTITSLTATPATATPEPSTLAMSVPVVSIGLGLWWLRRRRTIASA